MKSSNVTSGTPNSGSPAGTSPTTGNSSARPNAATTAVALDRTFGRRADLLAHSKVVEQLAQESVTVPVRFGSVLTGAESVVTDLLGPSEPWFTEVLASLEGVQQFSLRATYEREQVLAEIVRADPRVAELRARTRDLPAGTMHPDLIALGEAVSAAWEQKREEESRVLLSHVTPLVVDLREKPVSGDHVLDVAMLVERTRRDELEAVLEDVAEAVHEHGQMRSCGWERRLHTGCVEVDVAFGLRI